MNKQAQEIIDIFHKAVKEYNTYKSGGTTMISDVQVSAVRSPTSLKRLLRFGFYCGDEEKDSSGEIYYPMKNMWSLNRTVDDDTAKIVVDVITKEAMNYPKSSQQNAYTF